MTKAELEEKVLALVELTGGTWEQLEARLDELWNTAYSDGHTDGYDEGFDNGYDEGGYDITQEM